MNSIQLLIKQFASARTYYFSAKFIKGQAYTNYNQLNHGKCNSTIYLYMSLKGINLNEIEHSTFKNKSNKPLTFCR